MNRAKSTQRPTNYHAYLLRLWRESAEGAWRLSLQGGKARERLGFADLESLVAYLLWVMEKTPDPPHVNSPVSDGEQ